MWKYHFIIATDWLNKRKFIFSRIFTLLRKSQCQERLTILFKDIINCKFEGLLFPRGPSFYFTPTYCALCSVYLRGDITYLEECQNDIQVVMGWVVYLLGRTFSAHLKKFIFQEETKVMCFLLFLFSFVFPKKKVVGQACLRTIVPQALSYCS